MHHNIPKQTWGLLEPWGVYRGDAGLRKEWGNKECDDLVANSWNGGRNTNRCPICNNCGKNYFLILTFSNNTKFKL